MRRAALWSGTSAAAIALACIACTLTTDLDGLSEPPAGDAGGSTSEVGTSSGALPEASADAADAADASPSAVYAATVLADGPVAYYRFEDPSDANSAKDEVGTHPAEATSAGVTFGKPGVRGNGATFDGTDGTRLDVGDAFDFAGQKPFSIEFWIRSSTGDVGGQIVHKRDESVPNGFKGYILYGDQGTPHFEAWGTDMNAYSTEVLGTSFSHIVLTVSYATGKGNAKMYVNAKPSPIGGYDNTIDLADTPVHLLFGKFFAGVLDEVALYDKALPADRILEHYRAGR